MQDFATLIGTLFGAIIAGAIAIVTQRAANNQRLQELKLNLSEQRTQWATDHEMSQLVEFFELVQVLSSDLTHFRVIEFHKIDRPKKELPSWTRDPDEAAKSFDKSFNDVYAKAAFMDEDILEFVDYVLKRRSEWMVAKSAQEGLEILKKFEDELMQLKDRLSERYRDIVSARKLGQDTEAIAK